MFGPTNHSVWFSFLSQDPHLSSSQVADPHVCWDAVYTVGHDRQDHATDGQSGVGDLGSKICVTRRDLSKLQQINLV